MMHCSCDDQDDNTLVDFSCIPDNPNAQYDEKILEICDDEIDNNCDGNTDITDITCICDPGEQNDRCWPLTGGPIENVITNTILATK